MLTSGTTFLPVASLSIKGSGSASAGCPIPLIKPSLLVLSKWCQVTNYWFYIQMEEWMSDNGAMKHWFKVSYHSFQKNTDIQTVTWGHIHTKTCVWIYSNYIRNFKNLEATKMSFRRQVGTWTVEDPAMEFYPVLKVNELSSPEKTWRILNVYHWEKERRLSAEELMLLNRGVGEESRETLGPRGDPTSRS